MNRAHPVVRRIKSIRRNILQTMINIPGWRTNRKFVIFESDDWGSIRMPSREVYETLLKSGDPVDTDPFTRYDALESDDDLSLLMECLTKYQDGKGHHPVLTANCAVANPDFDKIDASGYREFYYEPFTETLKKYPQHKGSFELWQQGIKQNVFFPQLHCREHMNVTRWLKHLQEGQGDTVKAFKYRMISTGSSFTPVNKYAYMDAFNYDRAEELDTIQAILQDGAQLFKTIFGYSSKSLIVPCYIWSRELETAMAHCNIKYLQGSTVQLVPRTTEGTKSFGKKWHYIGQVNRYKQRYLVRNCVFEPSWNQELDWVQQCLREITIAFRWNKPATISTHRLNYIGTLDESNRANNLKLLSLLLSKILELWPEVEFITSVELGDLMAKA